MLNLVPDPQGAFDAKQGWLRFPSPEQRPAAIGSRGRRAAVALVPRPHLEAAADAFGPGAFLAPFVDQLHFRFVVLGHQLERRHTLVYRPFRRDIILPDEAMVAVDQGDELAQRDIAFSGFAMEHAIQLTAIP